MISPKIYKIKVYRKDIYIFYYNFIILNMLCSYHSQIFFTFNKFF